MKIYKIFIVLILFSKFTSSYAEEVHLLSNDVLQIVEKLPGGDPIKESEGHFNLTPQQTDQIVAYTQARNDLAIHNKVIFNSASSCPLKRPPVVALALNTPTSQVAFIQINPSIGNTPSPNQTVVPPVSLPEEVYNQLFQDPRNWKNILVASKDKLNSDQKIELISKLGNFFSNGYNFARYNDSNATGFVPIEELLVSVKTGKPGGICRDIALAQSQMLEALGFKNNYSVMYKTYQGRHVTVISTDPETGNIIKFNYGEVTTSQKGTGTKALAQDNTLPDVGLKYNVYDTHGKPVVQVPSELGQILSESTGGIDREFKNKQYNLAKVSFKKNGVHGNIFSGQTTTGDQVNGVALFTQFEGDHYQAHLGVAAANVKGERQITGLSAEHLYINAGGETATESVTIGAANARVVAGAELGGMVSDINTRNRLTGLVLAGNSELDYSAEAFVGLRTTGKSSDGRMVITNNTLINVYPDIGHVASADSIVLAKNSIVLDTQLSYQLDEVEKAILLRSAVVLRNYGTSAIIEAGYDDNGGRIKYLAGVRMPLEAQPTFLPGGSSSAYARVEKSISKSMTFKVELENDNSGTAARAAIDTKLD
jgi:hypothetical protein